MSQTYYFDYVVVLHSCQNGNLLANSPKHGIIHPAVTHNSGFANELHYHLQKSKRDNVVKTITDIRSKIQCQSHCRYGCIWKCFLTSCPSHLLVAFQTNPKAPLPTALTGWYSSLNWPSQARDCSRSTVERNASPWLASTILYREENELWTRHWIRTIMGPT